MNNASGKAIDLGESVAGEEDPGASIDMGNGDASKQTSRERMKDCPNCDGKGRVDADRCPSCGGTGKVPADT